MAGIEKVVEPLVSGNIGSQVADVATGVSTARPDNLQTFLSKELIKFIQGNELLGLVFAVLGVAGIVFLVIWLMKGLLGFRKDAAGTRKDDADAKKTMLDNVVRLGQIRDKHGAQEDEHNLRLSMLIEQLERGASADTIDRDREDVIDQYCQQYLPTLEAYLDAFSILRERERCVRFIETTLLKQLKTSHRFIQIVNHPNILQQIKRAPLRFNVDTFDSIWAFARKNLRFRDWKLRKAVKREREVWRNMGDHPVGQ